MGRRHHRHSRRPHREPGARDGRAAPAASIEQGWRAAYGCAFRNSGETARAIALFNTMLGCWNQEGGALFLPSASAGKLDADKFPSVPAPEGKMLGAKEYPLAAEAWNLPLCGRPGPRGHDPRHHHVSVQHRRRIFQSRLPGRMLRRVGYRRRHRRADERDLHGRRLRPARHELPGAPRGSRVRRRQDSRRHAA